MNTFVKFVIVIYGKRTSCCPQIPKNAYHYVKSGRKELNESGNIGANGGEMHHLRIIWTC